MTSDPTALDSLVTREQSTRAMRTADSPNRDPKIAGWILSIVGIAGIAAPAWALDVSRKPTQYTIQKWDAGTGLSHESIQAMVQTPDGYLWLGTMGGLVRFDGVRFTHYTPHNSALPHMNVWSLAVDPSGRLWLGTDGAGVAIWNGDGTVEHFGKAQGLTSDKIRPILMAKDGSVWVATNGGGVNRYKDGRWTALTSKDGLANDYVWSLAEDARGRIWIGTNGKGIDVWEAGHIVEHHDVENGLPQGAIGALMFARNGDLWAGTFDGLARLREGQWSRWSRKDGLPAQVVRALREDSDGHIWIGTAEGVARIRDGVIEPLPAEDGAYVRAMIEDREGNLWVGFYGAGLQRMSDETFFVVGRPEGAPFLSTHTVIEAADGAMWVGTYRGAWRLKDGGFTSVAAKDGLPSDSVGALAEDHDGGIWIGTIARGLGYWRAGKVRKYTREDGLPSDDIRTILVDRSGTTWVGTMQGTAELRDGRWKVHRTGLPGEAVRVLSEGRDALWAGTTQGLARYKDGQWTSVPLTGTAGPPAILSLHEDVDGTLWIGTVDQGLCRLEGGSSTCFRIAGALFDTSLCRILEDDLGYLWVGTPNGVVRVAKKDLKGATVGATVPFQAFGRDDGMRSSQVNGGSTPSGMRARDGRLWFATMAGLAVVDPRRIQRNTLAPLVRIEDLLVDGAPVPLGKPELGPDARRFELRYTGVSLSSLDKVSFRYRLDPFDNEWIEAGHRRVAYYTSLPAGQYVFRVTACNNDGACDEKGASTSFTLKPHLYQTRGFWIVVTLALMGVGATAYRIRIAQLRAREVELHRRVDEAVAQIQVLDGMLPICAGCKKIRNDTGYWDQIETYISKNSRASFSHGMCPECLARLYPEYVTNQTKPPAGPG
jgi:ligand-binding sensor domain-containing protein